MSRTSALACAVVSCALIPGAATGAPAGPHAPGALAGPRAPGAPAAARSSFPMDARTIRARVSGRALAVALPVGAVPGAGRLALRVLDLDGRVLGRAEEAVAASRAPATIQIRVPLWTAPSGDMDLWRLAWRFSPRAGAEATGVVGLSEVLGVPFLSLRGQTALLAGSRAALRLSVRDHRGRAQGGVRVTLHLRTPMGALLAKGESDVGGDLQLTVPVPEAWAGARARLTVQASAGPFQRTFHALVTVRREAQALLTTDKPIYQPGQTLHLRVLALRQPARRPLAGRPTRFLLRDPGGTILAEQRGVTDDFGVASTALPISDGLRPGDYRAEVVVMADRRTAVEAERTVKVFRYEVPDFRVSLAPARPFVQPGSRATLTLVAETLSGQPLRHARASVKATLRASYSRRGYGRVCHRELERLDGRTDAFGQWAFEVPLARYRTLCDLLPDALLLEAEVEAPGGLRQRATKVLPVAYGLIQVAATPEAGKLLREVPQRLLLSAAKPDGAPAKATFTVTLHAANLPRAEGAPVPQGMRTLTLPADAHGIATLTVVPTSELLSVTLSAKDAQGHHATRSLTLLTAAPRVLVRPEQAVVTAGQRLAVTVIAPRPGRVVQVDVKRGEQTVHTATARMSGTRGRVLLGLPADVDGLCGLAVRVDAPGGEWQEGHAPVLVRPARWLDVAVTSDRGVYAPGQTATLALRVTDEQGRGRVAALGLRLVDEGVYLLAGVEARSEHGALLLPGQVATPPAVAGFTLKGLMEDPRAAVPPRVAALLLAHLQRLAWSMAEDSLVHRGAEDVPAWRRGLGRRLKRRLAGDFTRRFHAYARVQRQRWIAENRKRRLCQGERVSTDDPEALSVAGQLPATILRDPWGELLTWEIDPDWRRDERFRVTIHSSGPDGRSGTEDDVSVGPFALLVPPLRRSRTCGVGYGAGGFGVGSYASRRPVVFMSRASVMGRLDSGAPQPWASGGPELRLREDFRETLAVYPGLRTGEDGTLRLPVRLADNLTTWTITALASDREGRLGGRVSRIRTFLPFSVDVRVPPRLTRGDVVTARVVVRNELAAPQVVRVGLKPAPWYAQLPSPGVDLSLGPGGAGPTLRTRRTALRPATLTRVVGPKAALALSFPIRALRLGAHRLQITAESPARADAVARPVQVVPEGVAMHDGASGMLASARTHDLSLPRDLVPDTTGVEAALEADVMASTWGSFEGLLRRPYGCFEQTSSTTYPNLLVLRHLGAGGGHREARAKARAFLAEGYQRLTTFEVERSGGFSLFGHAPAQPMLTAFGLGEFHDLATVMTVDRAIIRRIQRYLARRQREDGTWLPEGSLIESGAATPRGVLGATAYVALQLARSGYRGPALGKALKALRRREAELRKDPWALALAVRALARSGRPVDVALARRLVSSLPALARGDRQRQAWRPAGEGTLTGAGEAAEVETTALAILALLRTGTRPDLVLPALRSLLARRVPDGAWSTTQATVLALEALLEGRSYVAFQPPRRVHVLVDGQPVGTLQPPRGPRSVPVRLSVPWPLAPGRHRVELRPEGGGRALYRVALRYHTHRAPPPTAAASAQLGFSVSWSHRRARPGETLTAEVRVENRLGRGLEAPMAEIGLPPGLRLLEGTLRDLVRRGTLSQWERRGSQLLLYFVRLPAGRTVLPLKLQAEAPLAARIPASRLYEYYRPGTSYYAPAGHIAVTRPAPAETQLGRLLGI